MLRTTWKIQVKYTTTLVTPARVDVSEGCGHAEMHVMNVASSSRTVMKVFANISIAVLHMYENISRSKEFCLCVEGGFTDIQII